MKKFILHWLDKTTSEVEGYSIEEAFMRAGYGSSAILALDWYEEVEADVQV